MCVDFDVRGKRDFFTGGSIIMDYGFIDGLNVLMMELFLTNMQPLASQDVN